jgi:hypothetical protein
MGACQRPVLARNGPLDVFGGQHQQTLLDAAANSGKEVFHDLDVLLGVHSSFSLLLGSDRDRSDRLGCVVGGHVVFISRT